MRTLSKSRRRFAVSAIVTALALCLSATALAQTGMEFADDPVNPKFYTGGTFWALLSIAMMITFGSISKNPWVAAVAGILPLAYAIAKGDFTPIVLVMIIVIGVACMLIFIMFRR